MGLYLKNARAAARRAVVEEQRRAEGLPVQSAAGALPDERREQLDDIDPAWCPAWPIDWQRFFHLTRKHLEAGGQLPTKPGDVVHQAEDLGRWVRAQRLGFDSLTTAQQWLCEQVLGIKPVAEDEKPKPRRSQADKWALNLAAAAQYYQREGHLRVPRRHVETVVIGGGADGGRDGENDGRSSNGGEEHHLRLGAWVSNQRSRAATLPPERIEQLANIGMRWA
ncbi:helicase associated domain-containing protein [Streptomyces sp. NPDC090073]|uniref:helicase associated domain-containing protein n=1 Tax=Streptomyces sp. NPDC090073 TaxID=3365936 RepID=UPI0038141F25